MPLPSATARNKTALDQSTMLVAGSVTVLALLGIGFLIWYVVKNQAPDVKIHSGYAEFLSFVPCVGPLVQYQAPVPVSKPGLLLWNGRLAAELKVEGLKQKTAYLAGTRLLKGSKPAALAYSGHQFGNFARLGDGRALLLGTVMVPHGSILVPVHMQLKGTGPNAFSRRGDGLLPSGPALRELLLSEALHHLNVPTVRCLSVVSTGKKLRPRKAGDTDVRGAVLCRMLKSVERVGTFEHLAFNAPRLADGTKDMSGVKLLADHMIQNYFNELHQTLDGARQNTSIYGDLAMASARKNAELVASFMTYGFVHGVLNTDNVLVTGEVIDYGPCAFLDKFGLNTVFSSIDKKGRYGYGAQPDVMLWNMQQLLKVLKPLIKDKSEPPFDAPGTWEERVAKAYDSSFKHAFLKSMMARLGIRWKQGYEQSHNAVMERVEKEIEKDEAFVSEFLQALQESGSDYNDSFLELEEHLKQLIEGPVKQHRVTPGFIVWLEGNGDWLLRWLNRLKLNRTMQIGPYMEQVKDENYMQAALKIMQRSNPRFIPRNHVISRLVEQGTAKELQEALDMVCAPQSTKGQALFPKPGRQDLDTVTFCGT